MQLSKKLGLVILSIAIGVVVLTIFTTNMHSLVIGKDNTYQAPIVDAYLSTCPMINEWRPFANTAQRLDITEVKNRLERYVQNLGENYAVSEIMEFKNNFYAVIIEEDTGMGAFELLVNPYTGAITLEPGPNMMWNTKYGMHFKMMGGLSSQPRDVTIGESEAKEIALRYLMKTFQGTIMVEEPTRFYGYYTFDYMINGVIHGMLSVNGFTGEVWYHSWHGEFIQEIEVDEIE